MNNVPSNPIEYYEKLLPVNSEQRTVISEQRTVINS
ncbi:hypothetical protein NIES267_21110 [Calothrix parasitica NIES-267]|uniref:Uncharacterized protein n=1 Tax=Calothrix parasitica NIES-267 TaxID=1973488 RepID=A0A1Z4LN30_9CYAN|nr:hypothetical protein NIES267_21110 [Calothrix parasitica NIES-267]